MDLDKALAMEKASFEKRIELRLKKGQDYANKKNCLQNFQKVAQLLDTLDIDSGKSYGVALIYAVLKIDRLCNLIFRNKTINPANEAIADTIDDLQNYLDLFKECWLNDFIQESDNAD